jgi:hypothetical protein
MGLRFFRPKSLRLSLIAAVLILGFQNCEQPGSISLNPQSEVGKGVSGSSTDGQDGAIDQSENPPDGSRGPASAGGSGSIPGSGPGSGAGAGTGTGAGPAPGTPPGPATPPPVMPQIFTTETYVTTKLNTPSEFTLTAVSGEKLGGLILNGLSIDPASVSCQTGTVTAIPEFDFRFKYTPNFGYRGREVVTFLAKDSKQNIVKFNVTLVVDNPLQLIKPALAIRGMGCIQCHAQVKSNIITDFGFGSPFFFNSNMGGSWWKSGGLYGDHANTFSTMKLTSSVNVIVPTAALPTGIATATGTSTLARYIKAQLLLSTSADTRASLVQEKSKIYIGAPTELNILQSFSMESATRLAYFKNSELAVPLTGLSDQTTYFKNQGVLNCEGDLALRGPVYFNNLEVNSATGCRIYVIGSVFIFGPIVQSNLSDIRNLQITSTHSINLGLGSMKKNGVFCDSTSRYATDTANYGVSSLKNRYVSFWTVPSQVIRSQSNASLFGGSVMAEASTIESKEGALLDASCRAEGRNVSFNRLLLNAPSVQSRYEGDIIGTIIAEYSIMSLGQFKFQYDEVFDKVPIFPFFDHKIYLDIKD